jgi:hypothetical protein
MALMPGGSVPNERPGSQHRRAKQYCRHTETPAPAAPSGLGKQGKDLPGEPAGLDLRAVRLAAVVRLGPSDHGLAHHLDVRRIMDLLLLGPSEVSRT